MKKLSNMKENRWREERFRCKMTWWGRLIKKKYRNKSKSRRYSLSHWLRLNRAKFWRRSIGRRKLFKKIWFMINIKIRNKMTHCQLQIRLRTWVWWEMSLDFHTEEVKNAGIKECILDQEASLEAELLV